MLEKIQDRFNESIRTQIAAADALPKELAKAAQLIADCLLNGNKLLACGYGRSYANAQLLVSHLLHRYELSRPSLAAHLLNIDGVLASCLDQEQELAQLYRKQLQAVAKEGDLLVVFSPFGTEQVTVNAIHAANNENLTVLAFTGSRNEYTQSLLDETDLEIKIPSINEQRIIECHQFCVNLLCELVDHLLFNPTT